MEAEARHDPEMIHALMRAAHSLKGAARIIGLDSAVRLAHAMEDMLTAAQSGERQLTGRRLRPPSARHRRVQRLGQARSGRHPRRAGGSHLPESRSWPENSRSRRGPHRPRPLPHLRRRLPASLPKAEAAPKTSCREGDVASVRVAVENLNRLTGFAGECLVEVKTLHPLTETVQRIKQRHTILSNAIEQAIEALRKESGLEAQARLEEALRQSGWIHKALPLYQTDLERFSRKLEHLANRLYDEAVASRMRPFSDGLHGFARMVRDVAKSLGKSVRFEIEGEATPVDRDILEKLEAPADPPVAKRAWITAWSCRKRVCRRANRRKGSLTLGGAPCCRRAGDHRAGRRRGDRLGARPPAHRRQRLRLCRHGGEDERE